jgi:hypothetical protein
MDLDRKLDNVRHHAFNEGYYTAKAEIGKTLLETGEHNRAMVLLLPMKPENPYPRGDGK